eukprot:3425408-Amphidinium_carterae.1
MVSNFTTSLGIRFNGPLTIQLNQLLGSQGLQTNTLKKSGVSSISRPPLGDALGTLRGQAQ